MTGAEDLYLWRGAIWMSGTCYVDQYCQVLVAIYVCIGYIKIIIGDLDIFITPECGHVVILIFVDLDFYEFLLIAILWIYVVDSFYKYTKIYFWQYHRALLSLKLEKLNHFKSPEIQEYPSQMVASYIAMVAT